METLTLEGTWEEILQHSDYLAGQQVKVTILPQQLEVDETIEQASDSTLTASQNDPLAAFVGAVSHGTLATNLDADLYGS